MDEFFTKTNSGEIFDILTENESEEPGTEPVKELTTSAPIKDVFSSFPTTQSALNGESSKNVSEPPNEELKKTEDKGNLDMSSCGTKHVMDACNARSTKTPCI